MSAELLYSAPRDVLQPPCDADRCYLVKLWTANEKAKPLRLAFFVPLTDGEPPTFRDVLWWLAGDATALGSARGKLEQWAKGHGYPLDDATARLFALHKAGAGALEELLGELQYRRLHEIFASESALPRVDVTKPHGS